MGASPRTVTWPAPAVPVPLTWPRRDDRSPAMSPMACSGAVISTLATGSSTIGRAARTAAMKAFRPAVTKAISLLSTVWCLPSCTITRTSTSG